MSSRWVLSIRKAFLVFILASSFAVATPSAHAACVSGEIRYWISGDPSTHYAIGPKYCVQQTPWPESGYATDEYIVDRGIPTGYPSGVGYTFWYPSPI
jgi:hypothetical protein